jgi:hypothetical protein
MEIYERETTRLRHRVYVDGELTDADDGTVVLRIYNYEDSTHEEYQAEHDGDGLYSVLLPFDVTNTFEARTLAWAYEINTQPYESAREHLYVVKPTITYNQFARLHPNALDDIGPAEFRLVEPVVRKVIERYCNQVFTREDNRAYTVMGQNSDSLPLPRKALAVHSVSLLDASRTYADGEPIDNYYELTDYTIFDDDDRWSLRRRTSAPVSRGLTPTSNRRFFKYPNRYRILGDWGWDMVPEDVTIAAGILINDFSCQEASYREKYISNIRAGDWRMEFKLTGDETTGNANVDMILSSYRNVAMAVI